MPGFLIAPQVCEKLDCSLRWLDEQQRRGTFPAPVFFRGRRWWKASEIDEFLARHFGGAGV